jgi:uncharacterized protein YbjT (DUF2867 family)
MSLAPWRNTPRDGKRLRIVITGASGTVGSRTARLLAPGHQVRSLTRSPGRTGLAGHAVQADLADGARLREVMAGADALLLITFDPEHGVHDRNALAAAADAGVGHVVKLSASAVGDPHAQDLITSWQRDCEDRLTACGLPWTLLRPRAFMSNTLGWAPSIRDEGVVRTLYGTSRNACVDPDDVALAAARALTSVPARRAFTLTGPHALSAVDQVQHLSRVYLQPLRHEELTEGQALDLWRGRHSERLARALLDSARRQAAGAKAQVADDIQHLTGRRPGSYPQWATRHAAAFAGAVCAERLPDAARPLRRTSQDH